jgi:hypothetical protein
MGFANSCDTRSRLSASRSKSQHTLRPVGPVDRSNSSTNAGGSSPKDRPTFAEDFMLEHSHGQVQFTLIGLSASCEAVPKAMQNSAQSYGFPS